MKIVKILSAFSLLALLSACTGLYPCSSCDYSYVEPICSNCSYTYSQPTCSNCDNAYYYPGPYWAR